jgi:diacylglycerol kinase (ATP)
VRSSHSRAHSLIQSFYYAFQGFATGFAEERNFRVQCCYGLSVLLLLVWYQPPLVSGALAVATVLLLLGAELANSALERVVDLVSPQANVSAGKAKDMAAAGVMLVSFASAAVVLAVLSNEMKGESVVGLGGLYLGFIAVNRWKRGMAN